MTELFNHKAERDLLGGLMRGAGAVGVLSDLSSDGLRAYHFHWPLHREVYAALQSLGDQQTEPDASIVIGELKRLAKKVDDPATVHALAAAVGEDVGGDRLREYGRLIRDEADWRSIKAAHLDMGRAIAEQDRDALRHAHADMDAGPRENRKTRYGPDDIAEVLFDYLSQKGAPPALPLPFPAMTDVLGGGLWPGELWTLGGHTNVGKALDVDTPIPTPAGWTTMGALQAGDRVFGADGRSVRIKRTTSVMTGHPCFKVRFSGGASIIADAEHLWTVWDESVRKAFDRQDSGHAFPNGWATWAARDDVSSRWSSRERIQAQTMRSAGRTSREIGGVLGRTASAVQQQWNRRSDHSTHEPRARTLTTLELFANLRVHGSHNYCIPTAEPVERAAQELEIDPWVMGYLLGDGDSEDAGRVACEPVDRAWLIAAFRAAGVDARPHADDGHFGVRGLRPVWRRLGLTAKHIPDGYRLGSVEQRLALLQGLVDSDGCVDGHGSYRFTTTSADLAAGFSEVAASVGLRPTTYERQRSRKGRLNRLSWEVIVPSSIPLARLPRKVNEARHSWGREQVCRYIVSVEPVASRPVRCIEVDAADGLYLAGEQFIATHNSSWGDQCWDFAAGEEGGSHNLHAYLTEMGALERGLRMLTRRTGIPFRKFRKRTDLTASEIRRALDELQRLRWGFTIVSGWEPEEVRRDALNSRFDGVFVDLLHGFHYKDERELDRYTLLMKDLATTSTTLAGHPGMTVLAAVHLQHNAPERPTHDHIKGSGSPKQVADGCMFVRLEPRDKFGEVRAEIYATKGRSTDRFNFEMVQNPGRFTFDLPLDRDSAARDAAPADSMAF